MTLASIPSPSTAVWYIGPLPLRAYALCIVLGIVVACVLTEYRLRRRGAPPYAVLDVAVWAVPFGIVGARIYHVITSPQEYFGAEGNPVEALQIWGGGLGIWGAVAGGAVGALIGCRQLGIPLTFFADALAPGLALAQAVGRVGNWFNNELHGSPTTLPWGLEVHRMDPDNPGRAVLVDGVPELLPGLYHPAFLYEALWNVGVAALVLLVDRRVKLGRGRAFALYAMAYCAGRVWIEALRVDPASEFNGLRLNVYTSVLVFAAALVYFVLVRGPQEYLLPRPAESAAGSDGAGARRPVYLVVTEEQYRHHQATGELPESAAPPGPAARSADAEPPDSDQEPDDSQEDDSQEPAAARPPRPPAARAPDAAPDVEAEPGSGSAEPEGAQPQKKARP